MPYDQLGNFIYDEELPSTPSIDQMKLALAKQPPVMPSGGAAFGVFPQMTGRRANQTPTSVEQAKGMPVSALRGSIASGLGLPTDIANMLGGNPEAGLPISPAEAQDVFAGQQTQLPYDTEHFRKTLPFKQQGPANELAETLGTLAPAPVYPAAAKLAGKVGTAVGEGLNARLLSGQPLIPGLPAQPAAAMFAVRPQGSTNFKPAEGLVKDTIGQSLARLKTQLHDEKFLENLKLQEAENIVPAGMHAATHKVNEVNKALNNWVDKKIGSYLKNEIGTPNDPILKLHEEEGVSHLPESVFEEGHWIPQPTVDARRAAGFLEEGEAVGRHAKAGYPAEHEKNARKAELWEGLSDTALESLPASVYQAIIRGARETPQAAWRDHPNVERTLKFAENNPWIEKLPPDTPIHEMVDPTSAYIDLGFDHVMDVLREQIANGTLDPKKLDQVSLKDAIKRTHDYNVAAEEARINAAIEDKKYSNIVHESPSGIVVKLEKPGQFAKESDVMGHSVRGYEPPKDHPDWVKASGKGGSLGYGHGGWEAIKSGKAEVYSLRDHNNRSHGTIEVAPGQIHTTHDEMRKIYDQVDREANAKNLSDYHERDRYQANRVRELHNELIDKKQQEAPRRITQIKGPNNGSIDGKYTEALKNFLNENKWDEVPASELENANLVDTKGMQSVIRMLEDVLGDYHLPHERLELFSAAVDLTEAEGLTVPRFMTREEFRKFVEPPAPPEIKGHADGGKISKEEHSEPSTAPFSLTASNVFPQNPNALPNTAPPPADMIMGRVGHNIHGQHGTLALGATGRSMGTPEGRINKLAGVDVTYEHPSGAYARMNRIIDNPAFTKYELGWRKAFGDGGKAVSSDNGAAFGVYPSARVTPATPQQQADALNASKALSQFVIPQDAFDVATTIAPFGKVGKILAAGILAGDPAEAHAGNISSLLKLVAREAPEQFHSIREALLRTFNTGLEHSVVGSTNIARPAQVTAGELTSVKPNMTDISAARSKIRQSPIVDFHTHPSEAAGISDFHVTPSPADLNSWLTSYTTQRDRLPNEIRTMVATPPNRQEATRSGYNFFATDKPTQTFNPDAYNAAKYELQRSKGMQALKDNPAIAQYIENGYGDLGDLIEGATPMLLQKHYAQQGLGRHEMQLRNAPIGMPWSEITDQHLFEPMVAPSLEILKAKKFANGGQSVKPAAPKPAPTPDTIDINELLEESLLDRLGNSVQPMINGGLDAMFPPRKLIRNAIVEGGFRPLAREVQRDPYRAADQQEQYDRRVNEAKRLMGNEVRKPFGIAPVPEPAFDPSRALGDVNINEFPNPNNPLDPMKELRERMLRYISEVPRRAEGGSVKSNPTYNADQMRYALLRNK